MVMEIIGGYIANSLAIITDAMHQLCDVTGFLVSIYGLVVSKYPATKKLSFGYHRAEVLGALASILLIWGITVYLLYEAVLRCFHRTIVDGKLMIVVAILGLMLNCLRFFVIWKTNYSVHTPSAPAIQEDTEL